MIDPKEAIIKYELDSELDIKDIINEMGIEIINYLGLNKKSQVSVNSQQFKLKLSLFCDQVSEIIEDKLREKYGKLLAIIEPLARKDEKLKREIEIYVQKGSKLGKVVKFNKYQSDLIKQILKECDLMDKKKFIQICAKLKDKKGDRSFSRILRYFYERHIRKNPLNSSDLLGT